MRQANSRNMVDGRVDNDAARTKSIMRYKIVYIFASLRLSLVFLWTTHASPFIMLSVIRSFIQFFFSFRSVSLKFESHSLKHRNIYLFFCCFFAFSFSLLLFFCWPFLFRIILVLCEWRTHI